MNILWILQTNERSFLDDCRDFEVYGVRSPAYMSLQQLREGDLVLLRLRPASTAQEPEYVGPYMATGEKRPWVNEIETINGIWQKVNTLNSRGPRWLIRFPWCVFLSPTPEFTHDLRKINIFGKIRACEPISSPMSDKLLRSLTGCKPTQLPISLYPVSNRSEPDRYRTTRGVWVRSRAEHMIDNWFTEHGIMTHYERAIYLDNQRIVPDWYIPSIQTYVEYLGLLGNKKYEQTWSLKEQSYKKYKINYVTFDDNDLVDLDRNIPKKLPQLRVIGIFDGN